MATADTQWMPTTGRHSVAIGTSLRRALKARKGVAPPKRSNLPDKDFYSFRYNFKPESIEPSRSGTVEVKRGKDSTSVSLERPSTQAGENHLFKGAEQPVKEYDCVLIYDEELGTFTLEKIECFMGFTYDKKVSSSSVARKSPLATTPPSGQIKDTKDLEKELERDLLGSDADGEAVDDFDDVLAKVTGERREEEEEEEGEEIEIPPRKAPSPPPKPKVSRPVAPPPRKHESEPKPKPKPKEVPKAKREINTYGGDDFDLEEVLDFGVPARPSKRPKPSVSIGLALPGTTPSFVPPAPPTKPAAESDSEEDWDEVTHNDPVEEEIDLDAFGREMEAELEESDDDILAAAMSPDLEPMTNVSGRPISLNQFAGGQLSADEDDTSSSEDSDED
ncbi:RNA polymerase II transcription elongation factor-domain-containing protein [Suillus clintonianus]|uniref:RNA polymerase II transcription elongation factor-domain-containing protein n=1 Tax=Suillus clintonianus TaxID=1904413 RepID=UPI001B87A40D|nr:RNA polymerase II transcription elongation factor-domain-containing protein [Suillus clintonianus]KAG2148022.1 RNA polymerase II transcription elongation factor-domain-containing protein [Suillus clintonianus]